MILSVVVPMNVYLDPMVDLIHIPGVSQSMPEEPFQPLLESAQLSHGLWMMDTRPDMLLVEIIHTVIPDHLVLSTELAPVVGQQIIVLVSDQRFHCQDHCGILLVGYGLRPSPPGMIVFHGQDRDTVELGQICLDQAVGMTPFEPFPFILYLSFPFNLATSDQDVVDRRWPDPPGPGCG